MPKFKVVFITDRNQETDSKTWTNDFGSKLLGQWGFTCGEVHFAPDETREYGNSYDLGHILVDRGGYTKGDDCLTFVLNMAQQTDTQNILVLIHGYYNT